MKTLTKILFIALFITFSNGNSFGQGGFGIGSGSSKKTVKTPKTFEYIGCGFRLPYPNGRYSKSTSIGYSPYRELGEGMMNRFVSNSATYDFGCIELDDPPRKMKKDELISTLNSNTKAYLTDSSEYISLPTTTANEREIYQFKTKTDYLRRIKYILEGNRVLIFIAGSADAKGFEDALKLFDSVEHLSVKEIAEQRMATATKKSLPQSPTIELPQTDAAHNNLKGPVKSVRREAEDVPILVGASERRIRSEETYDRAGNLLKDFWFQDAGYPTSVAIYGFVEGKRVSDSEEIDGNSGFDIMSAGSGKVNLPPPDPRYEDRYEYKYDASKRIIERKEYSNQGTLNGIYTFTYKGDWMDEKWFGADGELNSTKRRQFDKNGNELNYKFWWYEKSDNEFETYNYKKFDKFGNWTERRVVKTIIDRGLNRTRTSNEFRTITYYGK